MYDIVEGEKLKEANVDFGKGGITLLVLVVSIIVIIILSTVTVLNINDTATDASRANFSKQLDTITEKSKEYYVQNNEMPTISGTNEMALSDVLTLGALSDEDKSILLSEMTEANDNYDNIEVKKFYQIDLQKISIKNSKRGNKSLGNNDVYLISDSMKIYYLRGIKIGTDKYFSLSSRLSSVQEIQGKTPIYSSVEVANLTVKKERNTWTNKIGIDVKVSMNDDEKLYIKLPNTDKKIVSTSKGLNTFKFDSLEELANNNFSNKVVDLTQEEINSFKILPQNNKNIIFIKTKNDNVVANITVDLSNYETELPTYDNSSIKLVESTDTNVLQIVVADAISDIKETRYEYLTKYNESNALVNYYGNVNINQDYLLNNGKKAILCFETTTCLTIPKNVNSVRVLLIDNAGNTNMFDVNNTSSPVILNAATTNITSKTLNFNVNVIAKNKNVSKIYTYLSIDGSSYSNEVIYDAVANSDNYSVNCTYSNIQSAKKNISIKIVAYDNSNPKKIIETKYLSATPVVEVEVPTNIYTNNFDFTTWVSGGEYYYSITFYITNTSNTSVNGWNLEMDFPSGLVVTNIWNATYASSNNRITFTNMSYNSVIDPQKTVSFGVQFKYSKLDFYPYNIKINGQNIPNKEKPAVSGNIDVAFNLQSKWQSGQYYYYSYSIDVTNKTSAAIKTWAFDIVTDSTTNMSQIWNGKYTKSNVTYTISNVDYNGALSINYKANFGMIIETKNANFIPVASNLKFTY